MNSYYHEIIISFNWWMVIMPAFLILSIFIGKKGAVLTRKGAVRYTFNERFAKIIASISGVVFFILLLVESTNGIIQWFDNSLTNQDSPAWSVILAPGAIAIIALLYGGIVFQTIQSTQRRQAQKLRKSITFYTNL